MKLFDKRFVHFMWDDELEGKEVFVADYITELRFSVEKDDKGLSDSVVYSGDESAPFKSASGHHTWRFAYYDENYKVKKAFGEGKKIQYRVKGFVDWEDYTNQNPCWGDEDREWRIKLEEEQWIAYLARETDGSCYLSACTDSYWKDVQKEFDAKTKLFIGAYDEVNKWYEFRQKFADVIEAWEDGKEIQVKAFTGLWYSASNPDWDVDAEYRVKLEDEKWIVYLDRLHDYLTACLEDRWESVQKKYHAKTKLFVGTESEVEEWYKSRQKFAEVIKAWEDGKEIQFKTSIGVWHLVFMPDWNVDIEYRVKPEGDKMTPTWSNIEDCKHCVYEPKATTQEPCNKCFGKSMFKLEEKEEETKDKMNPIQEKKMRRYNLNLGDWGELKEMAIKMFKGIAALNERFARKISGDEFVTQDDWKMMNDLWRTFNYTNDDNQLCKEDLHYLFTDDPDEEFVEIKAEKAKEEKKWRPYKTAEEFVQDFQERFRIKYNPSWSIPMIWLWDKELDRKCFVRDFESDKVMCGSTSWTMEELFDRWTYLDGSPVGMEVEK